MPPFKWDLNSSLGPQYQNFLSTFSNLFTTKVGTTRRGIKYVDRKLSKRPIRVSFPTFTLFKAQSSFHLLFTAEIRIMRGTIYVHMKISKVLIQVFPLFVFSDDGVYISRFQKLNHPFFIDIRKMFFEFQKILWHKKWKLVEQVVSSHIPTFARKKFSKVQNIHVLGLGFEGGFGVSHQNLNI